MNALHTKKPAPLLIFAAFAAIYLIWGSTYLAILFAIKNIPPFLMASLRFLIAGILLLAYARIRGESFPTLSATGRIAFSGLLMLFIGNGAVTWVEQYLPSGLVAIIAATVPLWFVLIDKRQWNYYFSNRQIILGLCIGFAGVVLLFAGKGFSGLPGGSMKWISVVVLLAGAVSWAAGSLYAKYREAKSSTVMKVAIQMLAAGIAFVPAAQISGEFVGFTLAQVTGQSVAALAYLIVMGSLIGYLAYMWLLSVRPASLVGTYAYVNPVVAVFLGWLLAQEPISTIQVVGLAVILAGLFLVNFSKEKKSAGVKVTRKQESEAAEKRA